MNESYPAKAAVAMTAQCPLHRLNLAAGAVPARAGMAVLSIRLGCGKSRRQGETMSQRMLIRVLISAALFALFLLHSAGWLGRGLLDNLEASSYDARLLLTLPRTVDKRIVIVDLDEKSLAAEGQWPWPRTKLA